jgi:hypothetical protein
VSTHGTGGVRISTRAERRPPGGTIAVDQQRSEEQRSEQHLHDEDGE